MLTAEERMELDVLRKHGAGIRELARVTGWSRNTVRRYLRDGNAVAVRKAAVRKSTFIKRLLHHKPPAWLTKHSVIAIVDLLTTPEEQSQIDDFVRMNIVKSLDLDSVMHAERNKLLEQLFQDRFEVARKQTLAGLVQASPIYNIQLADLISQWKEDYVYCATRLMEYWKKRSRGIVVVLDNTDQYSSGGQDFCFQIAQDISKRLQCITLISIREGAFSIQKYMDCSTPSKIQVST